MAVVAAGSGIGRSAGRGAGAGSHGALYWAVTVGLVVVAVGFAMWRRRR